MSEDIERAKTFFHGALVFTGKAIKELFDAARANPKISLAILAAIVVGIVGISFLTKAADAPTVDSRKEVTLVRVGDISGQEPLTIVGSVRSSREASVAPDASGAILGVYRSLGDFVNAGTIIAELKNDTQRASVTQARAAVEKAKSSVAVGGIGIDNAKNALASAESSAQNIIESAYTITDDAVKKKADQVFSNPNSTQPKFFVATSNSQNVLTAESKRLSVQLVLTRQAGAPEVSGVDTLLSELERLSVETATVRDFLSSVVAALNGAIATGSVTETQIASYRTDVGTAVTNVTAIRTTIISTIENLKAKRAAVAIAEENIANGTAGENADIVSAQANLTVALANLEKTFIRAPISGSISRLDLEIGNFVSIASPVVFITNENGLEVVAYVSERDIRDILVGSKVKVGGTFTGTVSKKATALDPITKKAELRIGVATPHNLVSGQSVTIAIERPVILAEGTPLTIPLSSLKITPEGPVVFTVANNVIEAHPVVLGTLRGSKVEIASGIDASMSIIEDARGLKAGQEVVVKE